MLSSYLCPGWDKKPDWVDQLLSPSREDPEMGDRELLMDDSLRGAPADQVSHAALIPVQGKTDSLPSPSIL